MRTRWIFIVSLSLLLISSALRAQQLSGDTLEGRLQLAASQGRASDQLIVLYLANRGSSVDVAKRAADNAIAAAGNSTRTDQQQGASSSSPHATSVAERPGIADLLNIAIERGIVSKAAAGSGVTLSTTPYAIETFFGAKDTPERWEAAGALRNIALSSTFSSEDAATSGNFSSFASGEVKWIVVGNRSPRDPKLLQKVRPILAAAFLSADNLIDAEACKKVLNSNTALADKQALDTWLQGQKVAGVTLTPVDVRAKLDSLFGPIANSFDAAPCAALYAQGNALIAAAFEQLKAETKKWLDLNKAQQFSVATLFVRDAQSSDYYAGKLLYGIDRGAPLTLNANGEIDWNRNATAPDGTALRRLRAYSAEFSVDSQRFGGGRLDGGLAAKWSKAKDAQSSNVIIQQAKLNLHLNEAVTLPISLTYAQKETQSIRKGWQFNFGLSGMLDDVLRQAFSK
jgi:hypothetical protein